jgi:hypothetical protein
MGYLLGTFKSNSANHLCFHENNELGRYWTRWFPLKYRQYDSFRPAPIKPTAFVPIVVDWPKYFLLYIWPPGLPAKQDCWSVIEQFLIRLPFPLHPKVGVKTTLSVL